MVFCVLLCVHCRSDGYKECLIDTTDFLIRCRLPIDGLLKMMGKTRMHNRMTNPLSLLRHLVTKSRLNKCLDYKKVI